MTKGELVKANAKLYADIDNCISDLMKARFDKDEESESRELSRMEGLLTATLQQLQCNQDYIIEQAKFDKREQ